VLHSKCKKAFADFVLLNAIMKEKKLNAFEDLAKLTFDNLAPDPDPIPEAAPEFVPQQLEAHYSTKGRAGRVVTLIKGFKGDKEALKALAKSLKRELKVGGTVKDNTILIQGDFRDNIIACLKAMGHQVKRIGG
jgi:translation initiation factor 1